jgi:hypothetical protein
VVRMLNIVSVTSVIIGVILIIIGVILIIYFGIKLLMNISHNNTVIFWHRNLLRLEDEGKIDRKTVNKEWNRYGKVRRG